MDEFNETLRSWQTFYFTIGGASAALVGLMFVALSLGMHLINEQTRANVEHFASPSVFYVVTTFLIAGAMLVPTYVPVTLGLLLFAGSSLGLFRTVWYAKGLVRAAIEHQDFDLQEWLMQIIGPVSAYVLILLASLAFTLNQWPLGFIVLWIATLDLIVCGIANTWSMVLWIIYQNKD
jgi:hypothetical protein